MSSNIVRKVKQFKKDQVIIAEGAPASNEIYFLYRGTALAEHGDNVIGKIESGEFFGEMAALLQTPRTATVRAITDCVVFVFEGIADQNLYEMIQRDPKIVRKLIETLALRLLETSRRHADEVTKLGNVANKHYHTISGAMYALERIREKYKVKFYDELYEFLKFSSGIQIGRKEDCDERYFPTTRPLL